MGAIAGIIAGALILLFLVFLAIMYYRKQYGGHTFAHIDGETKSYGGTHSSSQPSGVGGTFHRNSPNQGFELHRSRANTVNVTAEMICKLENSGRYMVEACLPALPMCLVTLMMYM